MFRGELGKRGEPVDLLAWINVGVGNPQLARRASRHTDHGAGVFLPPLPNLLFVNARELEPAFHERMFVGRVDREHWQSARRIVQGRLKDGLSHYIFPPNLKKMALSHFSCFGVGSRYRERAAMSLTKPHSLSRKRSASCLQKRTI